MTTIHIRDLALRCVIGIFPEERTKKQDVMINVSMDCEIPRAAETDSIEDAVDYKSINKDIITMVEASEYQLIETLAERIADIALARDHVERVRVSVDKPGALRFARSVAVDIVRDAPHG